MIVCVTIMEEYLLDENNWKLEAQSVIGDIGNHVKFVAISETLLNTNNKIFLNLETLENRTFCIELSASGFRIVGNAFNQNNLDESEYYETPYSLLNRISPMFSASFRDELLEKLAKA
ncbi:GSK3B-interacting protein [Coccinella septempunctata]|uniref:GSK3B-interacting protein n=1 Tax=Coccinella septempunctata TaxID=41139 RepID=UPI001D066B10|nr:GSK3B-interacting protein [Coccinella septempunctata]